MSTPRAGNPRSRTAVLIASIGLALTSTGCGSPEIGAPAAGPRPTVSSPATSHVPAPKPSTSKTPAAAHFVFPVAGNVGYARVHHDYPATDIMAKCGSTVRAVTDGTILQVTRVDRWKASVNSGATRGGLSISLKGADGVRYYGSHLEFINANLKAGVHVTAGQALGKIGQTGDASACHLHFGISPVCQGVGDWWIQRGEVWPWRYLDSWRKGGEKSPATEVSAWHSKHGCPTHPTVDP